MTTPVPISPQLSMDLRLRFLETLFASSTGSSTGSAASTATSTRLASPGTVASNAHSDSLARRIANIDTQLSQAIDSCGSGKEAIKRFVSTYQLNEPLLTIQPNPSPSSLSATELSPSAKVTLILEAEQEIRALERDLRDIEVLAERDVVGAGTLADHELLKPELGQVQQAITPLSKSYGALETRAITLLGRYNEYISTLSELFVSWNDIVSEAEATVTRLEKQKQQALDIS